MHTATHLKMPSNYDGIFVIGDIHADVDKLERSIRYASDNNLYIVMLGDVIDGGNSPYETTMEVIGILDNGTGSMVFGNHEYKWMQSILKDSPVSTSMMNTIFSVPDGKEYDFIENIKKIYEHDSTHVYIQYRNWHICHAALDKDLPQASDCGIIDESTVMFSIYGECAEDKDDSGHRARFYDWIHDIQLGNTVIVGHDRSPFGKASDGRAVMVTGDSGGVVIFTDTGCGKSDNGILTAVELIFDHDDDLMFSKFVHFG